MVRYLIIEDESLAYEELKRMMDLLRHDYQMAGWAQSITQSVALLKSQQFDLILADISLGDGLCFEIFEQIAVDIPVIFTTAYDEYAIKAFKANGIDYLLKPIEKEELESAIGRFEKRLIVPGDHAKMAKTANDTVFKFLVYMRTRRPIPTIFTVILTHIMCRERLKHVFTTKKRP